MGFKELVPKEDWDKTPESIKNVAEEIFSNLNDYSLPGKLPYMNSMTPGPKKLGNDTRVCSRIDK